MEKAQAIRAEEESVKWRECYLLGHKIQDCGFRDACIDVALEKMELDAGKSTDVVDCIYKATDSSSAHREFAVAIASHLWSEDEFRYVGRRDYHREFLEDLIADMGENSQRKARARRNPKDVFSKENHNCNFHDHDTKQRDCYKETYPAYK